MEDTETTLEEIEQHFGQVIKGYVRGSQETNSQMGPNFRANFSIVSEVSDDKSLPKAERKRLQIEHASDCSERAKLVKLADKLHNLR